MRVFKSKVFNRFARKSSLEDAELLDAVRRADRGLIDANLGGGLIKQRIARPGAGKSGGYRTIVVFHTEQRAVFVYGFGKNERENIEDGELTAFRRLASIMLAYTDRDLDIALRSGALIEVRDDQAIP